ncbi:MAG: hypothetical protein WBY94_16435 [Polyangiaceae bacterium]
MHVTPPAKAAPPGGAAHPTFMNPEAAGRAIQSRVDPRSPLTVADAAAKAGLALRDAESGLKWLSSEYRGQLRVTSEGELVHVFPTGFTKPWETRDAVQRVTRLMARGLAGAVRFLVRAWVTVVLVAYAAIFVGLLLGMTFARQGNDSRRNDEMPGGALAYAFLRVVGDALFWTFHPWSPFSVYYAPSPWEARGGYGRAIRRDSREPKVPFYERVNRFFFGPTEPPEDPRESERLVVAAIRAGKGRIGLADVMRVTGLPRDRADPMMARLMLDYDGDVNVSEDGGIVYRFAAIRKTASDKAEPEPPPAWDRVKPIAPLTGNSAGTNFVIAALNAFNLSMGLWAVDNDMTIERVTHLFDRVPHAIVDTGVPVALGVVPLVFSALLFVVPVVRAVARPLRRRAALEERGRLAVLREVIERVRGKKPITDAAVADSWRRATGRAVDPKRLDRELVALGGDVAIEPSGDTRWRFADLETEASAVEAERAAAADEEARLGEIVYATDER